MSPPQIRGNGAFLAVCIVLLLAGFVAVLLLNTAMAKGSFTMRDLQQRSDRLADTQDSLRHSIEAVSGPGPLAKRARAMGMVPAETAAFLRLSDATVLGVAKSAQKNTRFDVVTESTPLITRGPSPLRPVPRQTTPRAGTPSPAAVPSGTPAATATPSPSRTPATTPTPVPTTTSTSAKPSPTASPR